MRLYRRCKEWDLEASIVRCHLDAERGYVARAIERLDDLEKELGEDAKIWYARGILREKFLGQGLKAYECFVKAFELDPQHALAAYNAYVFAPNLAECLKWAEVAGKLLPKTKPALDAGIAQLRDKDDAYYGKVHLGDAAGNIVDSKAGTVAAHLELAFPLLGLEKQEEAALRRRRAELLRELDRAVSEQYATRYEQFAPQDRWALREAIDEVDRALALDKYDEKMWNFKSSWCNLMGRYQDSIEAADEALELAPEGYHRPYVNKANSLIRLHRIEEARECVQRASQIAEQSDRPEVRAEIPMIEEILSDIAADSRESELTFEEAGQVLSGIVTAAQVTARQEIGKREETLQQSVALFRVVLTRFPWGNPHVRGTALDYVPLMAQVLEFAPPEYWWMVMNGIERVDGEAFENCMLATLYIAAHAAPIMQRDALHLLLLTIFFSAIPGVAERLIESPPPNTFFRVSVLKNADTLRYHLVCQQYRRSILEVSAAATDEMTQLDHLMRQELARILPALPAAIAEQDPVEEADKARVRASTLSQLQGTPFVIGPSTPRLGLRPALPGDLIPSPDLSGTPFPQDLSPPPTSPVPRSFVGPLGCLVSMAAIVLAIAGMVLAFLQNPIGFWLLLAGVLAGSIGWRLLIAGDGQENHYLS